MAISKWLPVGTQLAERPGGMGGEPNCEEFLLGSVARWPPEPDGDQAPETTTHNARRHPIGH